MVKTFTLLLLISLNFSAYAQSIDPENIVNSLTSNFLSIAEDTAKPVMEAGERLFWMLLPISIVISGIKNIFKEGNIQNFMFDLVRLILVTGIFYFLLSNGKAIGFSIIDSFTSLANKESTGPSELFDLTLNIVSKCQKMIHKNFLKMVPMSIEYVLLIGFGIIMFLVVIKFTVLFITAKIVCIIGVFVLGFGSFNFTRQLSLNYLNTILSLSVQLLTMLIVVNTSCTLLKTIYEEACELENAGKVINYTECISILFVSIFLFVLSKTLPTIMAQLVSSFSKIKDSDMPLLGNLNKII